MSSISRLRTAAAVLLAASLHGPAAAGGVLRVCDDVVEPAALDPRREFSEKNHTLLQQIYEGLVRFDPEGRVVPALATSWKRLDPLTMEFELRKGVKFHNGEPFDAEAVKFSLEQFSDPAAGFPGAGFLSTIAGVEASGPHTVRVRTKAPDGVLLHRLAGLVTMLPPRLAARGGLAEQPVGTGPFRFQSREAGRRIVLDRNPSYWAPGVPSLSGLEFHFVPAEDQVQRLLDGRLDVVTELPGTETLKVMRSGAASVIKKASFYTAASSLATTHGPFKDKRVRQALNHAVNKDHLIRYDLLGNGKTSATLSMPGEAGHNPALQPYAYSLAKAKALLREAGLEKGFQVHALVKVQGMRTMKIIAQQLSLLGIEVLITPTTDGQAVIDMSRRQWDWVFAGCPDPMSHSFFIQSIFLSSLSPFSVTKDARYDELLAAMVGAVDPAEQQAAGEELDAYTHANALSLFTYQRIKTYGVRNGVSFVPTVTGMPYLDLSSIDEKALR
jgi:peptide/nickel transport system substrate-binding protein